MSRERMYFHYEQLEEFKNGMWRIVRGDERKEYAEKAANLMREPARFKAAMAQILIDWPMSCMQNLTSENSNRIAWLGHAGCCMEVGSSEENTRIGWHMLNPQEQAEANRVAGEVLADWERDNHQAAQQELFAC